MQAVLFVLLSSFSGRFPRYAIFGELLHCWLQFRFVQGEVVYTAYAQDAHTRESSANAIHERATRLAEVVGHCVVLSRHLNEDSFGLTPARQVFLTSKVLQIGVVYSEIGGMHGCGELVTICAIANE